MRILCLFALLTLVFSSGCATGRYSFFNGSHTAKHFTCVYDDLHELHKDIDICIFGINEDENDTAGFFNVKTGE